MKMPSIRAGSALRSFLVPLFFWASLFFSHCDPDGGYQYVYPISEETKDYCYFKEGSWWVYVDSNKMVYDTVQCVYDNLSDDSGLESAKFPYETIFLSLVSTYYGSQYSYQNGSADIVDTNRVESFITFLSPPSRSYYCGYFVSDVLDSFSYQNVVVVVRDDIQTLDGFKFLKSFEINGEFDIELPQLVSWSPHIGIVYKSMPDGTNWQLIDYHIVQ